MPPLSDPDRLAAYRDALANWRFTDYIQFDLTEHAFRWFRRELGGLTLKELGRLIHEYIAGGGTINEVAETRPEWVDLYEYHCDVRLTIREKQVHIETRLHYRLPVVPDESWILVVNIHEP